MKRISLLLYFLLCCAFLLCECKDSDKTPHPKYVFLFIGDGMGLCHITLAENYLSAKDGEIGGGNLSFSKFPVTGLVTTYSANSFITCSAAAATAFSTGFKTKNNMMSIAPDSITNLKSITYPLHDAGYKIGIATSVSIDHATPGNFYANALSRNDYYKIATQVATTGFDFFAGSGFIYPRGKNNDQPDVYEQLADAGYHILRGSHDAAQVTSKYGKIVLVQAEGKNNKNLPYAIDRQGDDMTLPQITKAAINALYNPKGFFAMIEGGQIDWAAHNNDAATVIREMIDFSDAIQIAIDFYRQHPSETLIIVTADHETGGMSIGRDGIYALNPLMYDMQPHSAVTQEDINSMRELDTKTHVAWTTDGHTGITVPLYAIGAGSQQFCGKMDNTDIPKRIMALMIKDLKTDIVLSE